MTDDAPEPVDNRTPAIAAATTATIGMVALGAAWAASQLFHDAVLTKATLDGVTLFINALPGIGSALMAVGAVAVATVRSWFHGKERRALKAQVAQMQVTQ